MTFIDGGYVRNWFARKWKAESPDFRKVANVLPQAMVIGGTRLEVIRNYYCDGVVDSRNPEYEKQEGRGCACRR